MTSTPPGSMPCTVETCERSFATEHALSVHLARTHRIPGSVRKKQRAIVPPPSPAVAPRSGAAISVALDRLNRWEIGAMSIEVSFEGSILDLEPHERVRFFALVDAIREAIDA